MTHTTLSRQLKALEEEGLIIRTEYQQIPPRVEYSLSEIGEKFKLVLDALEVWGQEYIKYLREDRMKWYKGIYYLNSIKRISLYSR